MSSSPLRVEVPGLGPVAVPEDLQAAAAALDARDLVPNDRTLSLATSPGDDAFERAFAPIAAAAANAHLTSVLGALERAGNDPIRRASGRDRAALVARVQRVVAGL